LIQEDVTAIIRQGINSDPETDSIVTRKTGKSREGIRDILCLKAAKNYTKSVEGADFAN
jgi:hypothetical protein